MFYVNFFLSISLSPFFDSFFVCFCVHRAGCRLLCVSSRSEHKLIVLRSFCRSQKAFDGTKQKQIVRVKHVFVVLYTSNTCEEETRRKNRKLHWELSGFLFSDIFFRSSLRSQFIKIVHIRVHTAGY